jgi:hypothetical protein
VIDEFLKYYEGIYRNATNMNIDVFRNPKNRKLVSNLLERLNNLYPSIDGKFLFDFIILQFNHYENFILARGKNRLQLSWLVGDKAIERWKNKSENWNYFNREFCKKYRIKAPEKKYQVNEEGRKEFRSRERKRFYNTERGLIHCMELELFESLNSQCLECNYKNICNGKSN